jgi:hypothetical protein
MLLMVEVKRLGQALEDVDGTWVLMPHGMNAVVAGKAGFRLG